MQLAVLGDDVFSPIGDQEVIEQSVRIIASRVKLEAHPVDIPHTLRAQLFFCTSLKKSWYASQVLGASSILYPAFSTSGRPTDVF
jgi:hypothetical protein